MQNWIVSNMKTKLKKEITKTFKELGLSIDIKAHLKQVDFLDVTFDLPSKTYKSYKKPYNSTIYVNSYSNHPPSIIRRIPKNDKYKSQIIKNKRNINII